MCACAAAGVLASSNAPTNIEPIILYRIFVIACYATIDVSNTEPR